MLDSDFYEARARPDDPSFKELWSTYSALLQHRGLETLRDVERDLEKQLAHFEEEKQKAQDSIAILEEQLREAGSNEEEEELHGYRSQDESELQMYHLYTLSIRRRLRVVRGVIEQFTWHGPDLKTPVHEAPGVEIQLEQQSDEVKQASEGRSEQDGDENKQPGRPPLTRADHQSTFQAILDVTAEYMPASRDGKSLVFKSRAKNKPSFCQKLVEKIPVDTQAAVCWRIGRAFEYVHQHFSISGLEKYWTKSGPYFDNANQNLFGRAIELLSQPKDESNK